MHSPDKDTATRGRKKLIKYLAASFIIIAAALFLIINHLEEREFSKEMPTEVRVIYVSGLNMERNKHKAWEADFGDGIVMVYIPPGKDIPGVWMGKTEVTVSQYMKFVDETESNEPEWKEKNSPFNLETGTDKYYENQVDNDFPVVGISLENAKAYCQWLSKKTGLNFRLPSGAQWQKAAQGTDGRDYPWGSSKPGINLANFGSRDRKTTRAGSFPGGASPYGLLDMAGSVEEMCENHVARGGSFYSNENDIKCVSQNQYDSTSRTNALGFRLCMTVKR